MSQLRQIFFDVFTDQQLTYSAVRITGIMGAIVFLALSIASYVQNKAFDMGAFAAGFAGVVLAMGGAQRITEPPPKKDAP